MADFETIRLEEDARGIATLTLNRPEKHNALNAPLIRELTAAAAQIRAKGTIRVVILEGAGKSFCAGGDLHWMREQREKPEQERVAEGMTLADMLYALDELPQPLIAKVKGSAFGGGVGMMSVCDIVIAADTMKWGLTETKLGLIPATIGPYVVRRLGEGATRRVFMNSKIFRAEDAKNLGLVSKIVTTDTLDKAVMEEAEAFLACAPGAVSNAKALAKFLARTPGDNRAHTVERLSERWADQECEEGISAFFERRKAGWVVE